MVFGHHDERRTIAWFLLDNRNRPLHDDVKVHTVNTDAGVVFDSQIDMFLNTEAESATSGKVALFQFVFLDLESPIENFLGL